MKVLAIALLMIVTLNADNDSSKLVLTAQESIESAKKDPSSLGNENLGKRAGLSAWNFYKYEDALASLYGKNINFTQSNTTRLDLYPEEIVDFNSKMWVSFKSDVSVKSLAIFQDVPNKKSLIAYIRTKKMSDKNISIKLTLSSSQNIIGVAQGEEGTFYIDKKSVRIRYASCDQEAIDKSITKEVYLKLMNLPVMRRQKIISTNGITKAKIDLGNPMLTEEEAEEFGVKTNFISKLEVKKKENILFEMYLSEYFRGAPQIKFTFSGTYNGEILDVVCTDIHGRVYSQSIQVQELTHAK